MSGHKERKQTGKHKSEERRAGFDFSLIFTAHHCVEVLCTSHHHAGRCSIYTIYYRRLTRFHHGDRCVQRQRTNINPTLVSFLAKTKMADLRAHQHQNIWMPPGGELRYRSSHDKCTAETLIKSIINTVINILHMCNITNVITSLLVKQTPAHL